MSRADHRYCPLCLPRLQMATVKLGIFVLRGGRRTLMITGSSCDLHTRAAGANVRVALERDAAKAARRQPALLDAADKEAIQ